MQLVYCNDSPVHNSLLGMTSCEECLLFRLRQSLAVDVRRSYYLLKFTLYAQSKGDVGFKLIINEPIRATLNSILIFYHSIHYL